jgi:hypothetical protein
VDGDGGRGQCEPGADRGRLQVQQEHGGKAGQDPLGPAGGAGQPGAGGERQRGHRDHRDGQRQQDRAHRPLQ